MFHVCCLLSDFSNHVRVKLKLLVWSMFLSYMIENYIPLLIAIQQRAFFYAGFGNIIFVRSNKMCPAAIKVSAAPRTLNVRKFAESRAGEVEGLHSILADRLGNNFRSQRNKRRRTTAHDNQLANKRFRKRQKKLLPTCANSVGDSVDSQKVSRRVRRRNEFKKNPQSGFTTSRDETRRLRTHVWHAKRFTMTKLWGFFLPLGLHGRYGRQLHSSSTLW